MFGFTGPLTIFAPTAEKNLGLSLAARLCILAAVAIFVGYLW